MPKKPASIPIPLSLLLDEVQRTRRANYRRYLILQFFTGLRLNEADKRKEAHHG
jgi:hypothetical protein